MAANKADPSLLQSARNTEVGERFNRTLFSALDALGEDRIEYALIGGVAASGMGRPRPTHDIDIFVRPEDAGAALTALERHGFRTEKTDVAWLFKGWKDEILVDVIFKSRGDIYFDTEMNQRAHLVDYHGRKVKTVSPEDLIIIKSAVHDEIGPHHWHDALAILSHATLDWDYLLKRARRAQRRVLALLIYAQANDVWIPNRVILELFRTVYGELNSSSMSAGSSPQLSSISGGRTAELRPSEQSRRAPDQYTAAHIKDALARDTRTCEQDLKVLVEGNRVILRGEVMSEELRSATERVARDAAPGYQVENQTKVQVLSAPEGAEAIR